MKLKELIQRVDKTSKFEAYVSLDSFAENAFNLYINIWEEQTKLKAYYTGCWYCTDSYVGFKVYFFNDEPVAVSAQLGRKLNETIDWVSEEAYKKVKEYIMSFLKESEDHIELTDLEAEIGETYKVHFYNQMFDYHKNNAIFNGIPVKIVNYKGAYNDGKFHQETVEIKYENGKTEWVQTSELDFPFNIKQQCETSI